MTALLSMQSGGFIRATAFRPKRLLRQPGGFEGLGSVCVLVNAENLAIAQV
jgi:hypothetical protein